MARRSAPTPQLSLFGPPPGQEESSAPENKYDVLAAPIGEEVEALGRALPPEIRLGGSTWSFPGWEGWIYGRKYAESRLARHGLGAYAHHPLLRAVGIDRTHYTPLPAADFALYAEAVPAHFRFLVKAHEALTISVYPDRPRYGAERGRTNPRFLDAVYATQEVVGPYVEGLGDKGGALLFQLAPQALGRPEEFAARLARFLGGLPRGPRYAVELRNRELLTPAYGQALASAGACHCFNVLPRMPDVLAQARALEGFEMPATIVRWLVAPGRTYEESGKEFAPFDRMQAPDPENRAAIATLARAAHSAGRGFLCTINNNAEGCAPASVLELARELVREA